MTNNNLPPTWTTSTPGTYSPPYSSGTVYPIDGVAKNPDIELLRAEINGSKSEIQQLRVNHQASEGRMVYERMQLEARIKSLETQITAFTEVMNRMGTTVDAVVRVLREIGGSEAMEELDIAEFLRELGVDNDKKPQAS